jgi:hypothetical protein
VRGAEIGPSRRVQGWCAPHSQHMQHMQHMQTG